MRFKDYKCPKCKNIREIQVEDTHQFPEKIPCLKCEEMAIKMPAPIPSFTSQGKCGNSKRSI